MKIFVALLALALLALQYRLWLSDDGVKEVRRLESAVAAQERENADLEARNAQLAAEVENLKEGLDAVEERARSDLGMVRANETFYQVVTPAPQDPLPESAEPTDGNAADSESPGRGPLGSQQASAR
jgi:cell division protein FtsB